MLGVIFPLHSPGSQKSHLFDHSLVTALENFLSDDLNLIICCLATHLLTFRIGPEAPAFPSQSLQWLLSLELRLEDGMNASKSSNGLHNIFPFKQPCLLPPQAWMASPRRLCKGTEISREAVADGRNRGFQHPCEILGTQNRFL